MKSPIQSSLVTISDPRQAAMFGHPMRCRLLLWCSAKERSLSQMKARFGLSLSKLHYHVTRLVRAGLLAVSRTQPRGGRPIRFYRAVAEQFRIAQEHLPAGPSERWAAELRRSLNDAANRVEGMAATYSADPEGELMVRMLPPAPGARPPRVKEMWRVVRLDAQQRVELAREMTELLDRYAGPAGSAASELYWVHAAFAPRRTADG
jgi:DNA-binding transcriptional ArsR family regulator